MMLFSNRFGCFCRLINRVPQRRSKPVFVSLCCVTIFSLALYGYYFSFQLDDISCYNDTSGDVLLPVEERKIAEKSIFFHETSCREGLNSKQACAVEAVARSNPDWAVHVLLSGPVKSLIGQMRVLKFFNNVHISRLHIPEYMKGTLAENLFADGASQKRFIDVSKVLRFVTLYKWGGVYLDFDTLVVKSFNSLAKNWFIRDTENHKMYDGAMSLSQDQLGRIIAVKLLRDAVNFCSQRCSNSIDPPSISRALKEFCSYDSHSLIANSCKGLKIYSGEMFAPISKLVPKRHFVNGSLIWPLTFFYHIWDTRKTGSIYEESPFSKLAEQYCPSTYNSYGKDFGVKSENNINYLVSGLFRYLI